MFLKDALNLWEIGNFQTCPCKILEFNIELLPSLRFVRGPGWFYFFFFIQNKCVFYVVKMAFEEAFRAKQWSKKTHNDPFKNSIFPLTNKAPNVWGRKYIKQWVKLGCIEHSHRGREAFAHEELKMSRIQPSCELHLGGSERDRDRHREALRQAGAKPWRGAFWHNDSHLPLTGLGEVKLIMTAHRCWIALDEVNNWQSSKQVLNDLCYLPWNYGKFKVFLLEAAIKPKKELWGYISIVLAHLSTLITSSIMEDRKLFVKPSTFMTITAE